MKGKLFHVLLTGVVILLGNPPTCFQSQKVWTEEYLIVDTDQGACYNTITEMVCPQSGQSFYGQDAQYYGTQPSYQDNGDGTVTDLNTGLMWQKTPGEKVIFSEAVAGASTFSLAGYTDWRLPSIKELYSLILFSGTDPSGPESGSSTPSTGRARNTSRRPWAAVRRLSASTSPTGGSRVTAGSFPVAERWSSSCAMCGATPVTVRTTS